MSWYTLQAVLVDKLDTSECPAAGVGNGRYGQVNISSQPMQTLMVFL